MGSPDLIAPVPSPAHLDRFDQVGWVDQAACKGRTALFFPPRAERPQARFRREAQAGAVCRGCAVAEACRRHAREQREHGFWGGESEEDRHRAGFTVAAPIGVRGRGTIRVATVA